MPNNNVDQFLTEFDCVNSRFKDSYHKHNPGIIKSNKLWKLKKLNSSKVLQTNKNRLLPHREDITKGIEDCISVWSQKKWKTTGCFITLEE